MALQVVCSASSSAAGGSGNTGFSPGVFATQRVPAAVERVQRLLERGWCFAAQGLEGGGVQRGAVHAARALDQVVGLVHQQTHAPALLLGVAKPVGAEIEEVVVVAHRHIAPAQHFLAQVVGADAVGECNVAQGGLVQPAGLCGVGAGGGEAVVKTARQRTGLAVAGFVGVFAGLVARHALDHAQRQAGRRSVWGRAAQALQGVQRELATGGACGEIEKFVGAAVRVRRAARQTAWPRSCPGRWVPAPSAPGLPCACGTRLPPGRAGQRESR